MSALPNSWFTARYAAAAAHPVRARIARSGAIARLRALKTRCDAWLVTYSIAILRVSVGVVFLAFGLLKFLPGVSPAQDLVEQTTALLTLGLVPGSVALVFVATLESVIGLCLIANRRVRLAVHLLIFELIGILSPLLLLPGRMFHGPHGAPTLEGQYVLKDLIVVGAALVLATSVRGARFAGAPEECDVPSTASPGVGRGTGVSSGSQIHEWSRFSCITSASADSERWRSPSTRVLGPASYVTATSNQGNAMIVRDLSTVRTVDWGNGVSRRFLLEADGLGYSVTDTIVLAGTQSPLEYKHHLETCYCIAGRGEVVDADGRRYPIEPGTLYALDQHDAHHLVASPEEDLRLVCVFAPALIGDESHRLDADGFSHY